MREGGREKREKRGREREKQDWEEREIKTKRREVSLCTRVCVYARVGLGGLLGSLPPQPTPLNP